jgi:hypothetical protein
MALGDPYISLEEMRTYLKVKDGDTTHDVDIETAVKSASHDINSFCRRQFNKTEVASARIYEPVMPIDWVTVDDFYTTTGLIVEIGNERTGTYRTIDPTDFVATPRNGIVDGEPGWPFWTIRFHDDWLGVGDVVRVTAKWGWNEIPDSVIQSCKLLAATRYKLKDAPLGTAGLKRFSSKSHHCTAPCELLHNYIILMENLA